MLLRDQLLNQGGFCSSICVFFHQKGRRSSREVSQSHRYFFFEGIAVSQMTGERRVSGLHAHWNGINQARLMGLSLLQEPLFDAGLVLKGSARWLWELIAWTPVLLKQRKKKLILWFSISRVSSDWLGCTERGCSPVSSWMGMDE